MEGEGCLQEQKTTRSGSGSACACELKSFFAPTQSATTVAKRVAGAKRGGAKEKGKAKGKARGCRGSKNAHGKSKWRRRPQFVFSVRWRFDKVQPRYINKVDTRVCMARVGALQTPTT